MTDNNVITLGSNIDPAEKDRYLNKIKAVRSATDAAKGATPLGHVERPNIPFLKQEQPGVQPRAPGSPVLSATTQSQLEAANVAMSKEEKVLESNVKKEIEENALLDLLENETLNEADRILGNKKRRKAIESRCSSLEIEDLILKGEVRQTVPIIPGKLEVVFRSTLPEESLYIKKVIAEDDTKTSEQHTMERFAILQLCCSVVALNGTNLPNHLTPDDKVDSTMFAEKKKRLMKLSSYLLADLHLNLRWFDIRVRKLMNPEYLGNG